MAISSKVVGIVEALGLEQLLVPVDDPVVDRERQRMQHARRRPWQTARPASAKSLSISAGIGERGILEEAADIGQPAALLELPLLHVIAQMHDIEARLAGAELDDRLLALLLFGRRLGIDLDAGQFLELGEIF